MQRLGEQTQGGGGFLVGGEGDEPPPRPRQDSTKQMQPRSDGGPVEDQEPTWFPHRRPAPAVIVSTHNAFCAATSRRKFRADPVYPAVWATGSNRFAEIRPFDAATLATTSSVTDPKFLDRTARRRPASTVCPVLSLSMTRRTVFGVVPQISAAPR
jgi:hypothetical protein